MITPCKFSAHIIVMAKMKEAGEKQGQLAKIVGISRQSMQRKLRGVSSFTLKEARIISEHYDIDPTIFFS